jgi:hypothetical protein
VPVSVSVMLFLPLCRDIDVPVMVMEDQQTRSGLGGFVLDSSSGGKGRSKKDKRVCAIRVAMGTARSKHISSTVSSLARRVFSSAVNVLQLVDDNQTFVIRDS